MNADRAAELLQISERGLDLLQRFEADEEVKKAIQAVQSGFAPADVAKMYGLDYDAQTVGQESIPEGDIFVYECQSPRCKQKGRVATCSHGPDAIENDPDLSPPECPACRRSMIFQMSVEHEDMIGHLRRTYLPKARIKDPLARTDKAGADKEEDWDD